MDVKYFPNFCRANFKGLQNESNELLIELGDHFKEYLQEKFADKMEKLEPIWDINPINVIMEQGHPIKINGYHPALLLHFIEFLDLKSI
jgi:hypothetical protein